MRRRPLEAERTYGKQFVEETRAVLNICVLFLPFPIFWALFDQTARNNKLRLIGITRITIFHFPIGQ
jgi:dipeptide/tripeptide permease